MADRDAPIEEDEEFDEMVDGCLHGIPWEEDCPWCEEDAEEI